MATWPLGRQNQSQLGNRCPHCWWRVGFGGGLLPPSIFSMLKLSLFLSQALSQRDPPHNNFFFFDGMKGSGVVECLGPK